MVIEIDIRLVPEKDGEAMVQMVRSYIQAQGFRILEKEPIPKERENLNIDGKTIEEQDTFKTLGITFSTKLDRTLWTVFSFHSGSLSPLKRT